MFGCVGMWFRNSFLSRMMPLAPSKRLLRWLQMKPVGMSCFAAVRRMFLNPVSPTEQDERGGSLENLSSVSVLKSSHLALQMLVYVQYGSMGSSGNQSNNVMKIGIWF